MLKRRCNVRYTCPFCGQVTKDDGSAIYLYHPLDILDDDWRKRVEIVGFALECRRCGAVKIAVDNRDEDAYLARDIDGWYAPENHDAVTPFFALMGEYIELAVGDMNQAASLMFQIAYNGWRKVIGYE